ncbi:MAG: putative quinol monooxygenase [Vicinamibacterales bacterium]
MFILLVEVDVRPELLDEFRAAIQDNAARSVERDDGCLRFDVAVDTEARNRFVLLEVYTNEAAWQAHRQSAHFLDYKSVADRALVSRKIRRLEPVSGHLPK